MRVLVTGGAGFIGSHLVDALLAAGHSVRVLDDFSTGNRSNLPPDGPDLEVLTGCVTEAGRVDESVTGMDAVAHLAAIASVQASVDAPVATHEVNFRGTLNVLESMRTHRVARLVYASSAAVYGNECAPPVPENAVLDPLTPYAADKLAGELYADFYGRQFGLEPAVFRFFNVYGPRQDPGSPYSGVISIFFDRLLRKQPVMIFGDGEQTRDFVYVADVVRILFRALQADRPPARGPVNVGTAIATSVTDLYQRVAGLVGSETAPTYGEPRVGEVRDSRADTSRLQARMPDDLPRTSIDDGLRSLYESLVRD